MGIVVKAEEDDDYYIVMECSSKNTGFEPQILLTMGGCMHRRLHPLDVLGFPEK